MTRTTRYVQPNQILAQANPLTIAAQLVVDEETSRPAIHRLGLAAHRLQHDMG